MRISPITYTKAIVLIKTYTNLCKVVQHTPLSW